MVDDIARKLERLPEGLQQEVADFIDFLVQKYGEKQAKGFSFAWEGGLSDLKARFTSTTLEHQASERQSS